MNPWNLSVHKTPSAHIFMTMAGRTLSKVVAGLAQGGQQPGQALGHVEQRSGACRSHTRREAVQQDRNLLVLGIGWESGSEFQDHGLMMWPLGSISCSGITSSFVPPKMNYLWRFQHMQGYQPLRNSPCILNYPALRSYSRIFWSLEACLTKTGNSVPQTP